MTPPEGFVIEGCQPPEGWTCGVDGGAATYRPVLLAELGPFGLTLTVPTKPGNYSIPVRQAYTTDPAVTWEPTLTVAAPEPDPEPTQDTSDSGDTADGDGDGTQDSTGSDPAPSPSRSQAPSSTGDGDDREAATGDSGSGSSTTPRRTQGRSSGSSFDITPRRTTPSAAPTAGAAVDEPAVAAPSLAAGDDEPAAEDDDATAVVAGDGTSGPGQPWSLPWQQWVGALLLLTGAAVLVVRQYGEQVAAAAGRVRDAGSTTLRRVPGPWSG